MNNPKQHVALSADQVLAPLIELRDQGKDAHVRAQLMITQVDIVLNQAKVDRMSMPLIGARQRMLFVVEEALNKIEDTLREMKTDYAAVISTMQQTAVTVKDANPFHREQGLQLIFEIESEALEAHKLISDFLELAEFKRSELLTIE